MTSKELVEKAYRDYPIGTKFISSVDGNRVREVQPYKEEKKVTWEYREDCIKGYDAKSFVIRTDSGLLNEGGFCSNPVICIDGVWAKIISSQINYNYLIL